MAGKLRILLCALALLCLSTRAQAAGEFVNGWPSSGGSLVLNTSTGKQIRAGDFLITWWAGGLSTNTLAGWTATVACTNHSYFYCVFTRLATATDVGKTYTWTGGQFNGGGVMAFRNVTGVDVAGAGTGATSTAPAAPTITLSNSGDILITCVAEPPTATAVNPTGFSTAFNEAGSAGVNFTAACAYKLNVASGATGSIAWGTIASGAWAADSLGLTLTKLGFFTPGD